MIQALQKIFNLILDTLIRGLDEKVRTIISIVLFFFAFGTFILSIRKKNDKAPLSIGWFIMTIILVALSVLYWVL